MDVHKIHAYYPIIARQNYLFTSPNPGQLRRLVKILGARHRTEWVGVVRRMGLAVQLGAEASPGAKLSVIPSRHCR